MHTSTAIYICIYQKYECSYTYVYLIHTVAMPRELMRLSAYFEPRQDSIAKFVEQLFIIKIHAWFHAMLSQLYK